MRRAFVFVAIGTMLLILSSCSTKQAEADAKDHLESRYDISVLEVNADHLSGMHPSRFYIMYSDSEGNTCEATTVYQNDSLIDPTSISCYDNLGRPVYSGDSPIR